MIRLITGDALEELKKLPDESVQCCITSPPYYGLRDYGTAIWNGGSSKCNHKVGRFTTACSDKQKSNNGSGDVQAKEICPKCGAIRVDNQIGLEQTPQEYITKLVAVFREVKRILKKNGTLWVNIGDSYNGSNGSGGDYNVGGLKEGQPKYPGRHIANLKPKDLIGIPWMLAFALREDGWYLRSDIIWKKPAPMPESVTDRCTKSHEYLFMLTKSSRYYYDSDAIAEPAKWIEVGNMRKGSTSKNGGSIENPVKGMGNTTGSFRAFKENGMHNKRDVWTINTQPFPEAHFAVMPEKLVEPCVLAGTKEGDTVLDPFSGAGTVALVATKHLRNAIGIDLNSEYNRIAYNRIMKEATFFAEFVE